MRTTTILVEVRAFEPLVVVAVAVEMTDEENGTLLHQTERPIDLETARAMASAGHIVTGPAGARAALSQ